MFRLGAEAYPATLFENVTLLKSTCCSLVETLTLLEAGGKHKSFDGWGRPSSFPLDGGNSRASCSERLQGPSGRQRVRTKRTVRTSQLIHATLSHGRQGLPRRLDRTPALRFAPTQTIAAVWAKTDANNATFDSPPRIINMSMSWDGRIDVPSMRPGSPHSVRGGGESYCDAVAKLFLKKSLNASRPSEYPSVTRKKCQNV